MSIDSLARRFYVITTFGEVGPVGVHELPELIEQGRIHMADMVRSATGRPLGTVADVVEGRVLTSMTAPGAAPRAAEERRRRNSSGTIPLSSEPGERRPPVMIWVLGGILALLIILLIANLGGSSGAGAPRPVQADKPELILVAGRVDERGAREILIRAVTPVETDVDVQVQREDPVAAIRLDPPGGLVTMRAGTHTVAVSLLPGSITGPQRAQVALAEGADYRIGSVRSITVEMVPVRRTFAWAAPTIAWEPFTAVGTSLRLDGGAGWDGPWKGKQIKGQAEPFPTLTAVTHLPPTVGHGLITRNDPGWNPSLRLLKQRIETGTVWWSCRLQGATMASGGHNWAGLALIDNRDWRWAIGGKGEGAGMRWYSGPKGADEERATRFWTQPTKAPVLMVVRLVLAPAGVTADTWFDPAAGQEPVAAQSLHVDGVPAFAFNCVHIGGGEGSSMRIADLRLGRTWQEVVPPAASSAGAVAAPVPVPVSAPVPVPVPVPVAASTASSRKAQDPTIAWEPAADMPGVWRGSGDGWVGNWEGDGLAWHSGLLGSSPRPGFVRVLASAGPEIKVTRVLRQRIDEGMIWMSFLARACPADRPYQQFSGLRLYDGDRSILSFAWNLTGNDQGHWSAIPKMREVRDQGAQKIAVPCDPRQVHRVVVKLHLDKDKSAWRLLLDPPSDREPDQTHGVVRYDMPPFGFDRIVLWAKDGSGLDFTDLRIGRTWSEVLQP